MSENLIYYNLNLTNNQDAPIPANIIDMRGKSVIGIPEMYEMSIVRFQVSAQLVPIFIPKIPDPLFPNATDMSITLKYLGLTISKQSINVSDLELKGVYSYSSFLENLNTASKLAFLAIADPGITATSAPLFFLDSSSSLISMYVQSDYVDGNPNRIEVFINNELMNKLHFPYSTFNGVGAVNGTDYELQIQNHAILIPSVGSRFGYPYSIVNILGDVLQLKQEYVSLNTWNGFKSIIFKSTSIPTNHEYIPNAGTIGTPAAFSDQTSAILTDFDLDQQIVDGSSNRGVFQYVPSGEYRMKSMRGLTEFNSIDCSVYVQDYEGRLYPIYLSKGTSMSVKIMFRKRKF